MRVTLGLQASNVLRYLGGAGERITSAQGRVVTGKRILRASDDVPGSSRAMSLRSSLAAIEQYQENSNLAASFLDTTDASLGGISDALSEVRRIAVAAANTSTDEVRRGYASALDGIMQRLVDLGNTQQNDRYLFAGTATNTKPFATGTPPAIYDYMGDSNYNSIWIQQGVYVEVNVPGNDVFNIGGMAIAGSADTFTMIEQLRQNILNDDITATSDMLTEIDKHISNVLAVRGEVGSRGQRVEINDQVLLASHERISDLLSITEDVDMPSAIVDLKTQENVYQAALAVTARIMELSLANYLK